MTLKNIIDINLITNIIVGIILIIIGNYLPKCKRNSIIGVRNKWSLKNDLLWSKSNRFGGVCFIISGLIIIIQSFLIKGILSTVVMLSILILSGIVSCVYSYKIYKEN
ncbi:immunity protein SdpI [Clostridium tepidiprofundi DSM 19306]|uniref:Immunity protein SdpI n=1 Tax=Clostridium tepidiprofundi DSM 19306 TaxID=1121338 RepID=A0A151B6D2_9CLOT|nr:immunity protein SdpI [Clostridium tepidiprofundi DSM 19306]